MVATSAVGWGLVGGAWYQSARLLELFDLDVVEQVVDGVLLAPVFGVLELLEGLGRDEATGAEEAAGDRQSVPRGFGGNMGAHSSVSSSWLASAVPLAGV